MTRTMALSLGTELGPYEILSPLGAGGMGEVYRARDTRLARDVAVKVLPEAVAKDEDRLRRFAQEARAVAALNHPNILSVHDIGAFEGTHYIVTELLEGSTLRDKLALGPIPARRATEYAVQIAQGLAAAHEKRIVHRDLKPENLFITKEGRVKILDFGLAKYTAGPLRGSAEAETTASEALTSPGAVLGTAGYMAPEQVRGQASDHRSDIFALGAVMYEMFAGQRAFQRDSSIETMNAVLKDEPPQIAATPHGQNVPALQRVVDRCLEKEPSRRFQSAQDVGFALDSVSAATITAQTQGIEGRTEHRSRWLTAALVTVLLLAVASAAFLWVRQPSYEQATYGRVTFRRGDIGSARFAPDGETIIYSARWGHPLEKLYSSRTDGTDVRALELPASTLLAVSRSGELAIRLASTARLARAPLGGGAPRELLDSVAYADWPPDATQLAIVRIENGKYRLQYPIGKTLYETTGFISDIRFSPRGDAIAFMDHPRLNDDQGTVAVVDLKGNKHTLTAEWVGEQGLAWSPDGSEVWFTAARKYDWSRDLYAVSRSGKQRLVLRAPGTLFLNDIASNGRVLLTLEERRIEVAAGEIGGETRVLSWLQIMQAASVSRDGKYAVLTDWSGSGGVDYDTYLAKLDGSPAVLLGSGVGGDISPDNKWVTSILPSQPTKVLLLPTGVGETRTVTASNFRYLDAVWTSDGQHIVVRGSESDHPLRFWVQDFVGGSPRPITPEGMPGIPVTVNHSDYISGRDVTGAVRLYPIDGGEPKIVTGVTQSDEVVGGSPDSEVVYVSPDTSAIPQQIVKLNLVTGQRQPFVAVSPSDAAGIVGLDRPRFSRDGKQYVYNQTRKLAVLYVATGLK
jgi:eukaryotic-like serine/threonine-protein kinase